MDRRIVIAVVGVAALVLMLGIGMIAGGGIVYAATQIRNERTAPLSPVIAQDSQGFDPALGVLVSQVDSEGPAAQAGIVRGDILLAMADQEVNRPGELLEILRTLEPGQEVDLIVLHGDDRREIVVRLGERSGQAFLGLSTCGGPGAFQAEIFLEGPGALILEVIPESPAERAGLQPGMIVLAVEGRELDADFDLAAAIAAQDAGDEIRLNVLRPGAEAGEVIVELAANPDGSGDAWLGVRYRMMPTRLEFDREGLPFRNLPGLPFHRDFGPLPGGGEIVPGAFVRHVIEGGPAELAGLQHGDLITALDGEEITSSQDLVEAIQDHQPGDRINLRVMRPDLEQELTIPVELGENPNQAGVAFLGVNLGEFIRFQHDGGGTVPDTGFFERFEEFLHQFEGRPLPRPFFEALPWPGNEA